MTPTSEMTGPAIRSATVKRRRLGSSSSDIPIAVMPLEISGWPGESRYPDRAMLVSVSRPKVAAKICARVEGRGGPKISSLSPRGGGAV